MFYSMHEISDIFFEIFDEIKYIVASLRPKIWFPFQIDFDPNFSEAASDWSFREAFMIWERTCLFLDVYTKKCDQCQYFNLKYVAQSNSDLEQFLTWSSIPFVCVYQVEAGRGSTTDFPSTQNTLLRLCSTNGCHAFRNCTKIVA